MFGGIAHKRALLCMAHTAVTPSQVPRRNRQTEDPGLVIPKPAGDPAHMAAGDGRSRADIGRCEAQGGAPRPPPQPNRPWG